MTYATEDVARVCHEANRALQVIQDDPSIPVSLPWDELDDETTASIIQGVAGIRSGKSPEESHEAWCAFKVEHGWMYGPVKDTEHKTHPLLVPYADLDEAAKAKDQLFHAIATVLTGGSL